METEKKKVRKKVEVKIKVKLSQKLKKVKARRAVKKMKEEGIINVDQIVIVNRLKVKKV